MAQPHAGWIKQIARNVTDPVDGFLLGIRYLIMDRDAIFTAEFRSFLKQEGVKAVQNPVQHSAAGRRIESRDANCEGDKVAFCGSPRRNATTCDELADAAMGDAGLEPTTSSL